MRCRAHKTATLNPIQHTVVGGHALLAPALSLKLLNTNAKVAEIHFYWNFHFRSGAKFI